MTIIFVLLTLTFSEIVEFDWKDRNIRIAFRIRISFPAERPERLSCYRNLTGGLFSDFVGVKKRTKKKTITITI